MEKRLDIGSERSGSHGNAGASKKKYVSTSAPLSPSPRRQADRIALSQSFPQRNPHHLTVATLQNPSGYHPDVVRVHFAEQGNNAPLPPAPRLPLRLVRVYRL